MTSRTNLILSIVVIFGMSPIVAPADRPPADAKKPPAVADAKQPAASRVLVTIGKETTVITKPLRKDGYPDYVAALNEIYGKDVTPANNAAVLLWKALGPAPMRVEDRAEYFRLLGISVPAEKGDYFVESEAFVRRRNPAQNPDDLARSADEINKLDEQSATADKQPWSQKECPLLAAWLDANEKPLDLAVEASRRRKFFDPLVVSEKAMLIEAKLPLALIERKIAIGLLERATLRLGEGKTEAAWQDILAAHRLARLCGQGPTGIHASVAVSLDRLAWLAGQVLLRYARPSAADALRMRDQLAKLAPLPDMAEKIDRAERFTFLDAVAFFARDRTASVSSLSGGKRQESIFGSIGNQLALASIDWDSLFRRGNSWFDRIVAALRKPSVHDQTRAIKPIEGDLSHLRKQAKKWTPSLLASPRRQVSDWIGNNFASLLIGSPAAVAVLENSAAMRFELDKLAFSLAAFHADDGSYPAQLSELVPKYAAKLPDDIFIAASLHYARDGDGYLLYSVGPNARDDRGRTADEDQDDKGWDDIVVRMAKSK